MEKTRTTHLFTPNSRSGSQKRAYLELNDADYAKITGKPGFFGSKANAKDGAARGAIITDQNTKRMFLVGWNSGYYSPTCPVSNYDIIEEVRISTGKAKDVPLYTQEIVDAFAKKAAAGK